MLWAHKAPAAVPGSITAKNDNNLVRPTTALNIYGLTFHILFFTHVDKLNKLCHSEPGQLLLNCGQFLSLLRLGATAFTVNCYPVRKGLHEVKQFLEESKSHFIEGSKERG